MMHAWIAKTQAWRQAAKSLQDALGRFLGIQLGVFGCNRFAMGFLRFAMGSNRGSESPLRINLEFAGRSGLWGGPVAERRFPKRPFEGAANIGDRPALLFRVT